MLLNSDTSFIHLYLNGPSKSTATKILRGVGRGYDPWTHSSCVSQFGFSMSFLFKKFTITDSFILGSDKHIHDRDMAWLLKSDGKLYCSLFKNF